MTPEREAEIRQRAAFAAECAVEGVGGPLDTIERERAQLLSELDAVRAERDTLAAALAEVTRTIAAGRDAVAAAAAAWEAGGDHETVLDAAEANMTDLNRVLAALPADLAAERDRRVRAEWTREDPIALAYGIATREDAGPNLGDVYERPDGGTMTVIEIKRGCWRVYVYKDERGGTHERQHHRGWVLRARAADERGGR